MAVFTTELQGSLLVSRADDLERQGSISVMDLEGLLTFRLTAVDPDPVEYAHMDEYARSLGYADEAALLAATGHSTSEEYAAAQGRGSVASLLEAAGYPSIKQVLQDMGVTID